MNRTEVISPCHRRSMARRILLSISLCFFVTSFTGCFLYQNLRAKDDLNNGVRFFNASMYQEAADNFKSAYTRNPELVQAKLFYATALFKMATNATDEAAKKKSIDEVLRFSKSLLEGGDSGKLNDDQKKIIHQAIISAYGLLKDDKSQREWWERKSKLPTLTNTEKSECYFQMAKIDLEQMSDLVDKYKNRPTPEEPFPAVMYKTLDQWEPRDKEEFNRLALQGLKFANQSISTDADNEYGFRTKAAILDRQIALETDKDKKAEMERERNSTRDKAEEINRRRAAETTGQAG